MLKKILLMLLVSVLLISACTPAPPEPDQPPQVETLEEPAVDVDETDQDLVQPVESMPCSTVYDYETTAETDQYQRLVNQQPPVTEEDWIYGNPDAPITIIEYADFQCPACVGFSLGIKQLIDQYPSSIRVVFRHLPLPTIHDKAYISSMAAEAAGAQDYFWEMHDLLYLNQREWSALSIEEFTDWALFQADILGMDVEQFSADLTDQESRANLEEITGERLTLGLNYTPFVVVNDRVWRENKPDLYGLIGVYEFGGVQTCPPWVINPDESITARLDTSAGEIMIELFADVAPLAVNSFVFLAQKGWYDDVYFHRVLEGFVAQAGDPSGLGVIGPGYSFVNETDNELSFDKPGILGMANAGADTNGSQFYITLGSAENLDGGYTIFGEVTEESLATLFEINLRDPQFAADFEDATVIYTIEIIKD